MTGKVYRIGDRLLRLLYVRRGEPTFEIEVHPLPIEWPEMSHKQSADASVRLRESTTGQTVE
jgi:hypothetical protein